VTTTLRRTPAPDRSDETGRRDEPWAARRFLFLVSGARRGGNTQALAERAAAHLPADCEQRWMHLGDLALAPFQDLRHVGTGEFPRPTGNERAVLAATIAATDLVIASPLYWYSLSTDAKQYLDYWSGWMRVPGLDFRQRMAGKTLWGVTAMAGSDPADADPVAGTLRLTAEYMRMRWGGLLLGSGNRPGQVLDDRAAVTGARGFFADVPATAAA
jgi:NAD(P)H-dependent FMN reductase